MPPKHTKKTTLFIGNCLAVLFVVFITLTIICETSSATTLDNNELLSKNSLLSKLIKSNDKRKPMNAENSKKYPSQGIKQLKKSISVRRRRQLDQLKDLDKSTATKINNNNNHNNNKREASIEKLKDDRLLPFLSVTPISLWDLGYYPDAEEGFYDEEMDELLKLKKKLEVLNNNQQNKRGDMDPTIEYDDSAHGADDKVPVRGDLVTRKKRSWGSSNEYDEYWGFDENDGVELSVESTEIDSRETNKKNNYLPNNNVNLHEFKRNYERRNLPTTEVATNPHSFSRAELEQKLQEYIAHNRPIVVGRPRNKPRENNLQTTTVKNNHFNLRDERRLSNLPVSAQIIILKNSTNGLESDLLRSRGNFDGEIDFPGINPHRGGLQASHFPSTTRVTTTRKPDVEPPGACIWAIVHCCTASSNRLIRCFEHMGCPGVNWDPDPCRRAIADAARAEIAKYYGNAG